MENYESIYEFYKHSGNLHKFNNLDFTVSKLLQKALYWYDNLEFTSYGVSIQFKT